MKSDKKIQQDVTEALQWEPILNATAIGVAVTDGVVTLSGHVDQYIKKRTAESVAKRVKNVKAVAVNISVEISSKDNSNDTEIGQAVVEAFRWNSLIPQDNIKVKVENGYITLEGCVEWQYQKQEAYKTVKPVLGVKEVYNLISVKPAISKALVKDQIKKAMARNADIKSDKIAIDISGRKVTLKGTAGSWQERTLIENAAWCSPGVTTVIDEIEVR
ncbi:BON domain-containing protein [Niabella drilacis]|uniref:Osmotically-inducible protein OsmY, contains BON domain n=1 Tax=Niabella drilacis (strain DSM 25811 / CCM 8410 / CCUG 62505 / LMG 26954 / E90) TaxID=1285928 RepID=A0A1G6RDL4_NIADE|nr:BON domain-containing protein [Niabella drilacis]SDD02541.1 Osmotically-inducible protein OsmY, contains BON domain [Niabella drilacis]